MEFSNKLILSLNHDLNILNGIIGEINQMLPSFQHSSWLYPTKSYKEVSEKSYLRSISKEKQYLGYLELIIDRLYLIINLVIKYTETFSNVPKEPKPKNVVRPTNLSLGASADLLWKKLLYLNNTFAAGNEEVLEGNSQADIFNKFTQTDTYSSRVCSSCATAISCIKEILNQLEINLETKFVRKVKQDLHEDIYDITRNGCMNRLTTAIVGDVRNLNNHLHTTDKQNKESSLKLRELTIKYGDSLKIVRNLEHSLEGVRKRLKNIRLKNRDLTNKLNGVLQMNQDNEYKLLLERSKIKTLEKAVQDSTVSLALFSTNNDKLLIDIQQAMNDKVSTSGERDMWKSRFTEMYLENRELKNKLELLEAEIKPIKKSMDKIGRDCEKLIETLEQSDLRIVQKTETLEKILQSFMLFASSKKIKDVNPTLMSNNKATISFQITGDPIADMLKQVEINNYNIKIMEKHNTSLLKTIQCVQRKTESIKES